LADVLSVSTATYVTTALKACSHQCWSLPQFNHRIYIQASSLLEISQHLPPSHKTLPATLVPENEVAFVAHPPPFPTSCWARISSGSYKNDIGYVSSRDEDSVDVLLAPRDLPYLSKDLKGKQGRELFDVQLAKEARLQVSCEDEENVSCNGQHYRLGLLRKRFHRRSIKLVKVPTPDEIAWHALSGIDPMLVQRSFTLFSAQFWREGDSTRVQTGELVDMVVTIASVNLEDECVTLLSPEGLSVERSIYDIRRLFNIGSSVRVIAGFCRDYQGTVVSKFEDMLTLHRNGIDDEVGTELYRVLSY
jgi:hypothetical protein